MNEFLKWYNNLPFAHVIESDAQKHGTKLNLWAAYTQGAEDAKKELDNTAPYYMDALDRERTLAEENEHLKKSLLEIYDLQMHHTNEFWTLMNHLFDRSDPGNPIPRGSN